VSKDRAILGAERFIILAAVIGLLRLLYSVAQTVILKGWIEVLLLQLMEPLQIQVSM
jgi:hypothetical protein